MKTYVLFRHPCSDGFGAAYAAYWTLAFGSLLNPVEYIGVNYNQDPPPMDDNSKVYILGFSYKRPVLESLIQRMSKVVIIDHHETAAEDLKDLPGAFTIFDPTTSGAVLSWNYFHPDCLPPVILLYIQDRVLCHWKLPHSKEINTFLRSYTFQPTEEGFTAFNNLNFRLDSLAFWDKVSLDTRRLDWLLSPIGRDWLYWELEHATPITRKTIDRAIPIVSITE